MDTKASARDIILAIVDNMRESGEPMLQTTLVPSHYDVYLHQGDHDRLSGIFSRITNEAEQALDAELTALNKKGASLFAGRSSKGMRFEAAEKNWSVKFHVDENQELTPGDILVDSRLALPAPLDFGVGTSTQRSATISSGGETRKIFRGEETKGAAGSAAPELARLSYQTSDGGEKEFLMTAPEISVGRGGRNEFCDLVLDAADISRRHFYLKRDPETREFFIQDVSRYGTAVDGEKLAPKAWVRLRSKATITLAERFSIEFQAL